MAADPANVHELTKIASEAGADALKDDLRYASDTGGWLPYGTMPKSTANVTQGRWLTPNAYTVPVGRCKVDRHVDRGSVPVACVGRDRFKVWPSPVEQPWWEDQPPTPTGQVALNGLSACNLQARSAPSRREAEGLYCQRVLTLVAPSSESTPNSR